MLPSPGSLGGMAINGGLGGRMASPVTVNAPGGVNAQRGYQNAPARGQSGTMTPGLNPQGFFPSGALTQTPANPNAFLHLQQWLAQHRA
jgi:hypothetical protein